MPVNPCVVSTTCLTGTPPTVAVTVRPESLYVVAPSFVRSMSKAAPRGLRGYADALGWNDLGEPTEMVTPLANRWSAPNLRSLPACAALAPAGPPPAPAP